MSSLLNHGLALKENNEYYRRREGVVGGRCFEEGVAIAFGTNFFTEELGWFRLTFTARREALEIGLQRLWKALQAIAQCDRV